MARLIGLPALHLDPCASPSVTPQPPMGLVEEVLYYCQRATEMFLAAAVLLAYFAVRLPSQVRRTMPKSTRPSPKPWGG